jgi:leucyl-tRNA synthetase
MFFTAPSEREVLWNNEALSGVEKFIINRLLPITNEYRGSDPRLKRYFNMDELTPDEKSIYVKLNQTIKRASECYERLQFNTVISALMELVRDFQPDKITKDELNDLMILRTIQIIAPLAPHIGEEMWQSVGGDESVFRSEWPEFDPDAMVGEVIEIAVQINGKLRGTVSVATDASQEEIEEAAFGNPKIRNYTDGKEILRKIHVKGRLLNVVVGG